MLTLGTILLGCSAGETDANPNQNSANLRRHYRFDGGVRLGLDGGASPNDAGASPNGNDGSIAATYGTSPVPTSAACPRTSFTAPTLVNPVDPRAYGAKCDGVTDDTDAFQRAIDASDVKVATGTCLINGKVTITVSDRHLECELGTVLKHTVRTDDSMFQFSGTISGNSVVNCDFEGANTPQPQHDWNAPGHYDNPVSTSGAVSSFLLAGNTFNQFFGQAMFQTYGSTHGGSNDQIVFNTFKSCPLYGPAFVAHTNGYIGYNQVIGCTAGVENDNAQQDTGGNVLECNAITANLAPGYITGGVYGLNADYSANIVRDNVVTGTNTGILETHQQNGQSAQYSNNACTNGCQLNPF